MIDTTTPNGDRDRPSDCEAAKNPRGPAMGPPETSSLTCEQLAHSYPHLRRLVKSDGRKHLGQ
jgi:hypothetical protein